MAGQAPGAFLQKLWTYQTQDRRLRKKIGVPGTAWCIWCEHKISFANKGKKHLMPYYVTDKHLERLKVRVVTVAGLPTCTDFRGTYRFWPSITISRFHAFCFSRFSRILPAFCTYRQSRRCVSAINSPLYVMNQC